MPDGDLLGKAQPGLVKCVQDEIERWEHAAKPLGITLFEAKALYAVAMVRQLADGALLMWNRPGPLELPGFVSLASGIETLGRCLRGCREEVKGSGDRLEDGLKYMMKDCGGMISTPHGGFDAAALRQIRNFTTHGGTTPTADDVLSPLVSRSLLNLLGHALTEYWEQLGRVGDPLREKLSDALIRPLVTRGRVIFVEDMHRFITSGAGAGGGIQWRHVIRPAAWGPVD